MNRIGLLTARPIHLLDRIFFALAIHLGAVALAKTKSPSIKLQDVSPLP